MSHVRACFCFLKKEIHVPIIGISLSRTRATRQQSIKTQRQSASEFLQIWLSHSFDLDMHSILSIFASNTSVTMPVDDHCPSLSNLTEFLQDAQAFLLLLAQIEEIGWTAIQLSSSADGSTLTLHHTYIDLGDRLHDLYMDISQRWPNERPHCRTHLPVEFSIESWSGKTSRLIEVINNFHSIVDSLQPFWAQLAEIERDAIVLDEKPISYASTTRRLKINDHVHVQIHVSEWIVHSHLRIELLDWSIQFFGVPFDDIPWPTLTHSFVRRTFGDESSSLERGTFEYHLESRTNSRHFLSQQLRLQSQVSDQQWTSPGMWHLLWIDFGSERNNDLLRNTELLQAVSWEMLDKLAEKESSATRRWWSSWYRRRRANGNDHE